MHAESSGRRRLSAPRGATRTAVAGLIAIGALTFGLLSAGGAASQKFYTDAMNTTSAVAGTAQDYTLTITNDPSSGSNTIGSANITIPVGYSGVTLKTAPVTTSPAGKNWTAKVNGGAIELRSGKQSTSGLAINEWVSVSFSATAPCTPGPYTWPAVVKQSNDFKGTDSSNIFQNAGSDPVVTVASGPGTKLVFTTASQTVTAPGPSGTITVQRRNACNQPASDGSLSVDLSTTSSAGIFTPASPLTIADGSSEASFTYSDTKAYEDVGSPSVQTPPGTPTITASATGLTGAQQQQTVNPQTTVASLAFTTQPPTWVAKDAQFTVGVTAKDQYGNPVPGHTVSIALANNPNGATLTCYPSTCLATTNTVGVASFTLSLDKDSVGYTLVAMGSPSANSNAFNVADQIADCSHGPCNPSGSDGAGTSTNTTLNGFTGKAAVAVDPTIGVRFDLCGGLQQQVGSGTVFETVDSGSGTWTITMQVAKSALVDPARGAALYDVCLGTVNLSKTTPYVGSDGDQPSCGSLTDYSWPAKGGCAKYDGTKNFWGNVPDAAANVKKCSDVAFPAILSKNKTGSGDLVITLCVPSPWDGAGGFH
jgi:hypothetical protein